MFRRLKHRVPTAIYSLYFYLRIVQSRVIMDCVSGFAAVYKFSADADLCGEFICKLFNLLKKGA